MNKTYIFTQTASGDRTNIMSSFPLWDKEMFIKNVKSGNNYGRYRCGAIGGYMRLLKDLSLEEFDQIFSPDEFTKEEITELFRKEISLKYGEHADRVKIKALPKKDLERGCVYKDISGSEWLYLGEVEKTTDKTYKEVYQSKKKPIEVEKGYGFKYYYPNRDINAQITILKSPKKLIERVEGVKVELLSEYTFEYTRGYYTKEEHQIILKLL